MVATTRRLVRRLGDRLLLDPGALETATALSSIAVVAPFTRSGCCVSTECCKLEVNALNQLHRHVAAVSCPQAQPHQCPRALGMRGFGMLRVLSQTSTDKEQIDCFWRPRVPTSSSARLQPQTRQHTLDNRDYNRMKGTSSLSTCTFKTGRAVNRQSASKKRCLMFTYSAGIRGVIMVS